MYRHLLTGEILLLKSLPIICINIHGIFFYSIDLLVSWSYCFYVNNQYASMYKIPMTIQLEWLGDSIRFKFKDKIKFEDKTLHRKRLQYPVNDDKSNHVVKMECFAFLTFGLVPIQTWIIVQFIPFRRKMINLIEN